MNRHHPYGGNAYESPTRRGGGPGPDRGHRFQERGSGPHRGRGYGRGRGGSGGYNNSTHNNYDGYMSSYGGQDPTPPDYGSYSSSYGGQSQGGSQDPYYSNYSGGPTSSYQGQSSGYDQTYGGKYEDGAGGNYDDDGGYGRGPRRPARKERDDKVHDSIIEERIQRERPCRTLFIRNIKYETNSEDVRRIFEEHGEIKTFFDLISTRGMVFVTYYDLRAAERARERLQGSEISGRPIDVHYSLPRDDRGGDKNQLQGTLQVTLSSSSAPIDDNEVRRKFQQFGDVKSVRPVNDRVDSRYVEFYDTRACMDAYDRLRHQGLQDGVMDIDFAWDPTSDGPPQSHRNESQGGGGGRDWDEGHRGGSRFGGRGRRGRGGGGRGGRDDYYDDRRGSDHGRSGRDDRARGGRYDDDWNRGSGGGNRQGHSDRYGDSRSGYGSTAGGGGYGANASHSSGGGYGPPPPAPPTGPAASESNDRLEQARKVQQLLAALKPPQPGEIPQPAVPPPPVAPPTSGYSGMPPPVMPNLPPGANLYFAQPPPTALQAPPPPGFAPYGAPIPPQTSTPQPQPPPPAPGTSTLPPGLLSMLQSVSQQHSQHALPSAPPPQPAQYGYGAPPPGSAGPAGASYRPPYPYMPPPPGK